MKPALLLSFGYPDNAARRMATCAQAAGRVVVRDTYEFDSLALDDFSALLISMHSDQRHLAARAAVIDTFLRGGGTVVANGHVAYPFLPGIGAFHPLQDYRLDDLVVKRATHHPVWRGVDDNDLTFRRGVAGFYGRGWHEAPERATIIHTLGMQRRPVDFIYPVERGRVLFHGGNDLWQYGGSADSTRHILPQLMAWLFEERKAA